MIDTSFREEILDRSSAPKNRREAYTPYFWGLPGGDFAERSWALMELI